MASWYGNTDYQAADPRLIAAAAGGGLGALRGVGDIANQMTADRIKEEELAMRMAADKRAQEQLDMQKQQYAEQKADKQFASDYLINLQKPRQLAEASALFKQVDADKAAFDKRMESVAYTEPEKVYTSGTTDQATKDRLVASGLVNPAEVERKTKQQTDLAGMVLAPTEAMKETEYQHALRTAVELTKNGRVAPISVLERLEALRVADIAANKEKQKLFEAQKKQLSNDIDSLQIKAAEAYDKSLRGVFGKNGISQNDDGSYTINPSAANIKATDKELAGYSAGMAEILKAVNDGKFGTQKADAIAKAVDMYDVLMRTEGVNAKDAAKIVAETVPNMKGEDGIGNLWGLTTAKLKDLQIDPKVMEAIVKTGVKRERLDQQTGSVNAASQSLTAQVASAQAIKKAAELGAVTSKQAGLLMTPEERQYAATKNRLDEILKPAVDAEHWSASGKEYLTTKDGKTTANIPTNIQKEMDFANSQLMIPQKVRTKDGREVAVKYSDDDRAAILSQVMSESKFDAKATGDKGTAHGLFQWRLDRADALRKFAGEQDISRIPEEKQYEFFTNEMASRPPVDKRYGSMLEEFQAIDGAKNKAEYLSKHYEVAKGTSTLEGEAKVRGELADALLKKYQESQAGLTNDALSRSMEAGRNIKEFNVRTGKANEITRNTIMRPAISLYDRMTYDPLAPTGPGNIDAPTARKLSSDISTLVKDDINNSILNRAAKSTAGFFGKDDSVNNYENRTLARVNTLLKSAGVDTSNPEELLNAAGGLDSESKKPVIKLAHDKLMQEDAEYRKYYDSQQLNDAASMVGRTAVDAVGGVVLEKLLASYLTNRAITKTAKGFAERMAKSAARNAKRNTKTDDVIEVGSNQLTPQKQKAIDDYINAYIDKFGKSPSIEEIRTLFGL